MWVRREVLDELNASPEWNKKFEEAKTVDEQQVIVDFCRLRGYVVVGLVELGVAG